MGDWGRLPVSSARQHHRHKKKWRHTRQLWNLPKRNQSRQRRQRLLARLDPQFFDRSTEGQDRHGATVQVEEVVVLVDAKVLEDRRP